MLKKQERSRHDTEVRTSNAICMISDPEPGGIHPISEKESLALTRFGDRIRIRDSGDISILAFGCCPAAGGPKQLDTGAAQVG